jgi:hypothetical protein
MRCTIVLFVLAQLTLLPILAVAQNAAETKAAAGGNSRFEVLTRGPVHEGFATQYQTTSVAGATIDKQPPAAIEELPPDVRPAGDNIQWLPGYWGWDADAKDFLWVSGTYRNAPPGQRWVPGYWNKTAAGYQWMSGFWLSGSVEQVIYNSPPPQSVERGPTSEAPAAGYFWNPGVFQPAGGKYAWRPGYWAPYQQNFVWVPARNVLTAGGYVYAPGYWDYRLDQRGTLFAPVRVNLAANAGGSLRLAPAAIIPATALQYHLFAQANSGTYLFGNYYGDEYAAAGVRPWYASQVVKGVPDPLFGYYSWYYGRGGANYLDIMTRWNAHFTSNVNLRPAQTLAGQLNLATQKAGAKNLANSLLAVNLTDAVSAAPTSFVNLSGDERTSLLAATDGLRVLSAQRLKVEGGGGGALNVVGNVGTAANVATQSLKLPAVSLPAVAPGVVPADPSELIKGVPVVPDVGGALPELPGLPRLPF